MTYPVFVLMYHPDLPATITNPVRVATQAVDDREAGGWILVDGAPPVDTPSTFLTEVTGDARYEQLIDRASSSTGYVPVLQDDGTLLLVPPSSAVDDADVAALVDNEATATSEALRAAFDARYPPLGGAFPSPPLPSNPAAVTVTVAADEAFLPHPSGTGTRIALGELAEPGRYDWVGNAGEPYTDTSWFSLPTLEAGTSKGDIGASQFAFRCLTNARWLMIESHLAAPGAFDGLVQVRVNGVLVTPAPQDFAGTYDGHVGGVDLTFVDDSYKTVEVFQVGSLYAVNHETGATVEPWKPAGQKKLLIVGDSWINGTAQSLPHRSVASALQIRSAWDVSYNGQGGTGYVAGTADSWKSVYGSALRLAAVTDYQPDVLVVVGSINDDELSGVGAAAAAYYAAVAAASPATKIIVIGPQFDFGTTPAVAAALETAADSAANVIGYVTPFDEGWDLAGVRGPTDNAHPSILGVEWYAALIERSVRRFTVAAGDNSW